MTLADHTLEFDSTVTPRGIVLGTGESLGICNAFTFECWVKPTSLSTAVTLLGCSDFWMLRISSSTIWISLNYWQSQTFSFGVNLWHHFAFRYDDINKEIRLYLNGRSIFSRSATTKVKATSSLFLAQRAVGTEPLDGQLTEARFWKFARTEAQIQGDMYRRLSGKEDGLGAYFPLDGREGDSDTAARDAKVDLDPNTLQPLAPRPPALITGATFVPSDLPLQRDPDAVVVAEFDGKYGCITVPDSPLLSFNKAFTVEAWVRPTGTGKPTYMFPIVSKHSAGQGWELRAGAGSVGFLVTINGAYHEVRAELPNGVWSHVAGVYSNGTLSIRINAREITKEAVASATLTQSSANLVIGGNAYWPKHKFQGEIAEVRIWNVARTYVQMWTTLVPASRLGEGEFPANLVAVYRMQCDAKDAKGDLDGTATFVRWSRSAPPLPPSSQEVIDAAASDDPEILVTQNVALAAQNEGLTTSIAVENQQCSETRDDEAVCREKINTDIDAITTLKKDEGEFLPYKPTYAARQSTEAVLQSELGDLLAPSSNIGISKFAQNLGIELANAQQSLGAQSQSLGAQGQSIALANVSLSMRMVMTSDGADGGAAVRFPTLDELAQMDTSSLSTFNLELDAQAPPQQEVQNHLVPTVTGYTETAARRKLADKGFGAKVAFQAADAKQANRVVTQLPTGGSSVLPGTDITIFIGRPVSA